MSSKKDATRLVQDLRRYFTTNRLPYRMDKRGGHWHVVNANGKSIHWFASTPGDVAFRQNTTAALRRKGIVDRTFR